MVAIQKLWLEGSQCGCMYVKNSECQTVLNYILQKTVRCREGVFECRGHGNGAFRVAQDLEKVEADTPMN